jgi:hypothetical protein
VVIQILQSFILLILAFTMFFGLGFIINMLLKTTWFPIYAYVGLIVGLVYWSWGTSYAFVDLLPLLSGLLGAVISGSVIKGLRLRGYKMF